MPTPTEILDDLVAGFEALYSAPVFGAVQNGAETGDKYILATITVDAVDYDLRVDYRVNGTATDMSNWQITCDSPHGTEDLFSYQTETATDATLLAAITDWLTALDARATNEAAFHAEFVAV